MNSEHKLMIAELVSLNKAAKKGPWYPQGVNSKGMAVYRIGPTEEKLIIAMRNNIDILLKLVMEA